MSFDDIGEAAVSVITVGGTLAACLLFVAALAAPFLLI